MKFEPALIFFARRKGLKSIGSANGAAAEPRRNPAVVPFTSSPHWKTALSRISVSI